MKKKILVINQYKSDNLGDKLLNKCLCDRIKEYGFEVINLGYAQTINQDVSYNCVKSNFVREIIYTLFPERLKYLFKYRIRLINESNTIDSKEIGAMVIGGGQLLKHDSVFYDCLKYWTNWAKKNNLYLCLFGIGIDTNISMNEINKYKSLLNEFNFINCRDSETLNFLRNKLNLKNVYNSPDIAFTLNKPKNIKKNNTVVVMPYSYGKAKSAFTLNQSKEMYYEEILNKFQNNVLNRKVILCATTTTDAMECFNYQKYLESKNINSTVEKVDTIQNLIEIISKADFIITGRMHAMIIACVVNTEVIPICISNKIKQFTHEFLNDDGFQTDTIKESRKGVFEMIDKIEEGCK